MKIFAIYTDVELTYKPVWFDDYRARYDQPYPLHITLKPPCYATEAELVDIRRKLDTFIHGLNISGHEIQIRCNDVVIDRKDGTIMLAIEDDGALTTLQKDLVGALGRHKYYEAVSESWERNFHPHITIARDLSSRMLIKAESELPGDDYPKGSIKEITLVAVERVGSEEAKKPENLTKYRL